MSVIKYNSTIHSCTKFTPYEIIIPSSKSSHIIDSFKTQIQNLKSQFKPIENNQFTNLIISKFNDIDSSVNSLLPVKKVKRWDSLGTAWKYLAGNPDANDLKIINSSINSLINNNNQQVRINREISLQMKEALFKTKESIQLLNSKSSELYSINIYLNLEFLYEKLNQIKETVMLAKIRLLNDRVLSPAEIDLLIKDLARENITVWKYHRSIDLCHYVHSYQRT